MATVLIAVVCIALLLRVTLVYANIDIIYGFLYRQNKENVFLIEKAIEINNMLTDIGNKICWHFDANRFYLINL